MLEVGLEIEKELKIDDIRTDNDKCQKVLGRICICIFQYLFYGIVYDF